MKKISASITPKSKIKALLNPFVALVSKSTKNTGPIVNDKIIPKGIAVRIASCIQTRCFLQNYIIFLAITDKLT